jgi:hypothetical protein
MIAETLAELARLLGVLVMIGALTVALIAIAPI